MQFDVFFQHPVFKKNIFVIKDYLEILSKFVKKNIFKKITLYLTEVLLYLPHLGILLPLIEIRGHRNAKKFQKAL